MGGWVYHGKGVQADAWEKVHRRAKGICIVTVYKPDFASATNQCIGLTV